MKTRVLILFILIEVVIIALVGYAIYKKQKDVLGVASVNPIKTENITYTQANGLKYFYEPQPDTIIEEDPEFLNLLGYPSNSKVRYTINEDGLNQRFNYNTEKPKNIFRIMAIGDSFTFGQNVNTENNYPSQLEDLLNNKLKCTNIDKFQVLNLGVGGYDIRYVVERYRIRGQQYNPDSILWLVIADDLQRINEIVRPKNNSYVEEIKKSAGDYDVLKNRISHDTWKRAIGESIEELGGEENVLNLQKQYLQKLNLYFNKDLVIFTFPFTAEKYKVVLHEFAESRPDIFFYDGIPNIYTEPSNYLRDRHPTAKGYTEIVNNLFNYLTKNKIIPCS